MYRCENCKGVVPPRHKLNRVVVETRQKTDPIFRKKRRSRGRRREAGANEPIGYAQGSEIAKELRVCSRCAADMAGGAAETDAA